MPENYVSEELCKARMASDTERFSRDKARLDKMETKVDGIEKLLHEVSECNAKLTVMIEGLNDNSDDHERRITDIEKKPKNYWDKVVTGVISAIVAALMAIVLGGAL